MVSVVAYNPTTRAFTAEEPPAGAAEPELSIEALHTHKRRPLVFRLRFGSATQCDVRHPQRSTFLALRNGYGKPPKSTIAFPCLEYGRNTETSRGRSCSIFGASQTFK